MVKLTPVTQRRCVRFACALALGVVLLGAYTRLTDAGLGCPDWPGCYGHLMVPQQQPVHQPPLVPHKAWTEMVHRYFAGSLGLLITLIAASTWSQRQHQRTAWRLSLALVFLVIAQATLGMWTVTWRLYPPVVMLHLIGGFSTLALLWRLHLALTPAPMLPTRRPPSLRLWTRLTLGTLILQIMLGGWTSANYAALVCPSFPHCLPPPLAMHYDISQAFQTLPAVGANFQGGLLSINARASIQMAHRFGALLTTLLIGSLALRVLLSAHLRNAHRLAKVLLLLLTTQVSLGITNILAVLPLSVAVAHNGVALLLLLTLLTMHYRLFSVSQDIIYGPTA